VYTLDRQKVERYESLIAGKMGISLATSAIPIGGALIDNHSESELADKGFEFFLPDFSKARRKYILRCFDRERFVLNLCEYLPLAGVAIRVIHIYGIGQYIMFVAERSGGSKAFWKGDTDSRMEVLWAEFEPRLWRPDEIMNFYVGTKKTGLTAGFDKPGFASALQQIKNGYEKNSAGPIWKKVKREAGEIVKDLLFAADRKWDDLKKEFDD
jgi:hypothetical protein